MAFGRRIPLADKLWFIRDYGRDDDGDGRSAMGTGRPSMLESLPLSPAASRPRQRIGDAVPSHRSISEMDENFLQYLSELANPILTEATPAPASRGITLGWLDNQFFGDCAVPISKTRAVRAWKILGAVLDLLTRPALTDYYKRCAYHFLCSPLGEHFLYVLAFNMDKEVKHTIASPTSTRIMSSMRSATTVTGLSTDTGEIGKQMYTAFHEIHMLAPSEKARLFGEGYATTMRTMLAALFSFSADVFIEQADTSWTLEYFRDASSSETSSSQYIKALMLFCERQTLGQGSIVPSPTFTVSCRLSEDISSETASSPGAVSRSPSPLRSSRLLRSPTTRIERARLAGRSTGTIATAPELSRTRANKLIKTIIEKLSAKEAAVLKQKTQHGQVALLCQVMIHILNNRTFRLTEDLQRQVSELFERAFHKTCLADTLPLQNVEALRNLARVYCDNYRGSATAAHIERLAFPRTWGQAICAFFTPAPPTLPEPEVVFDRSNPFLRTQSRRPELSTGPNSPDSLALSTAMDSVAHSLRTGDRVKTNPLQVTSAAPSR